MIDLPETTNVYKPMPKELFYMYLNPNSAAKKTFIDEIKSITWINTLSPETVAIEQGRHVSKIAIVEIVLNRQAISFRILEIVNQEIDGFAIFIIKYEEWQQLWCCDHKSIDPKTGHFNCKNYCQTNWMIADEISLKIDGENLDRVYENFLMQIIGKPFTVSIDSDLKQADEKIKKVKKTDKYAQLESLEATIKGLEDQIEKVQQFDKQVQLASDLQNAQDEIKKVKRLISTDPEIDQLEIESTPEEISEALRAFFPYAYVKMQNRTGKRVEYTLI